MRPYGFGIIGTGVIADAHALALAALPDRARLIAVADLSRARLRAFEAKHFAPFLETEHHRLLDRPDIDVVIIAAPPAAHEALVLDALAAGKHVVCEKPLAPSLAAADRIVAAAIHAPGRLGVVHQQRFRPDVQRLIWLRDQGWLGRLHLGTCIRLGALAGTAAATSGWWGRWDIAGGGVVMTQFIHELDLLLHVFGPADEVYGSMDTVGGGGVESEDTFTATIRFESGARVVCGSTVRTHRVATEMEVVGADASIALPWRVHARDRRYRAAIGGALAANFPRGTLDETGPLRTVGRLRRGVARHLARRRGRTLPPSGAHLPYLTAVLDALDVGAPLPATADEARSAVELCTAIYCSALVGSPVTLPLTAESRFYDGVTAEAYRDRSAPQRVA